VQIELKAVEKHLFYLYDQSVTKFVLKFRGNQLPVSAARWQRGSQIGFATFILRKFAELLITQLPLKLQKKISTP
jgi:hypothetical protein